MMSLSFFYSLYTVATYILYISFNIYTIPFILLTFFFTLCNFIIERIELTQIPVTKLRYRSQKYTPFHSILLQHIYYLFYNIYVVHFIFHCLKLHYRENRKCTVATLTLYIIPSHI